MCAKSAARALAPVLKEHRAVKKARTYAEALEELGGRPWREHEGTEQWFLVDDPRPATQDASRPPTMDTDAFRIPKRGLLDGWRRIVSVAAGVCVLALVIAAIAMPSSHPAAPVAPAAAPPTAPPPPAPPPPAPPPPAPPSVAQAPAVVAHAPLHKKTAPKKRRAKRR
jgi:hypothetical protein